MVVVPSLKHMTKVIIGIHGLGNKPSKETLEMWWVKSMQEGLRKTGKPFSLPKFELVYWADILNEKPLDEKIKDEEDPCFLREKYIPGKDRDYIIPAHPVRKKMLDFLEKQMDKIFLNEDMTINFSSISDTIIHKYFKDLGAYFSEKCLDERGMKCLARDIIRDRAVEVLHKYRKDDILLIGHSMGSIIAYDVLTFLMSELPIDTFVTIGSPLGLPIVMGKIAAINKLILKDKEKLKTPPGVRRNWYNFSDLEDNVAINYNLGDDYGENVNGVKATDFLVFNNYEINNKKNPHKSYGYLRAPEFSGVLFDFIQRGKESPVQRVLGLFMAFYERIKKIIGFNKK